MHNTADKKHAKIWKLKNLGNLWLGNRSSQMELPGRTESSRHGRPAGSPLNSPIHMLSLEIQIHLQSLWLQHRSIHIRYKYNKESLDPNLCNRRAHLRGFPKKTYQQTNKKGQIWQACQHSKVVQRGPKGCEMVNLDVVDYLGSFWAHYRTIWCSVIGVEFPQDATIHETFN